MKEKEVPNLGSKGLSNVSMHHFFNEILSLVFVVCFGGIEPLASVL
jgi:hypothetical protein